MKLTVHKDIKKDIKIIANLPQFLLFSRCNRFQHQKWLEGRGIASLKPKTLVDICNGELLGLKNGHGFIDR